MYVEVGLCHYSPKVVSVGKLGSTRPYCKFKYKMYSNPINHTTNAYCLICFSLCYIVNTSYSSVLKSSGFFFNFFSLKISYPLNHRRTFYLSFTWNNRPQPSNENNKNTQVTLNIVKYKINMWVFLSLPTFFTYLWKHRGKTISCEGENWASRALIASL